MDVDAGPANHERPPRKLQTANSRTNSQTTHPFVAQTSAVLDQSRTSPPGGCYRHPSLTDLARRAPADARVGRKNGAIRSNKRMDPLQGKSKKEVRGLARCPLHSRCCSVGCPTPAISCLGASLTPAVGAWGSPSSARRQRNLHNSCLELVQQ